MRLTIRHRTVYRYARPVRFLDHRLLVTPKSSQHLAVLCSQLSIEPAAELVWSEDAAGNTATTALFATGAEALSILAEHEVLHTAEPYPIYRLDPAAHRFPFTYAPEDLNLIGPALLDQDGAGEPILSAWLAAFCSSAPDDTLTLLKALNEAVGANIEYQVRNEEGTQRPADTLAFARGSCRDIAALFLAAARQLGFAARAASGYLFDPGSSAGDAGATHAWCEVFLPQAGWIAFDPTRRLVGSAGLVTVAVGATSDAVLPVVGGFVGSAADFVGMDVEVNVSAEGDTDGHRQSKCTG